MKEEDCHYEGYRISAVWDAEVGNETVGMYGKAGTYPDSGNRQNIRGSVVLVLAGAEVAFI